MTVQSGAGERGAGRSYAERPRRCSFWARRLCGCCESRIRFLVLEHILPGTPAAERPDDEATAAVAATLLALWVPVPARCGLPTVHQECAVLDDDQAVALLGRRLPPLAQLLGMTVERVAAWGLVRAVPAEAWHVQDTGHTAGGALAIAERLTQVVSSDT